MTSVTGVELGDFLALQKLEANGLDEAEDLGEGTDDDLSSPASAAMLATREWMMRRSGTTMMVVPESMIWCFSSRST